MTRPSFQFYPGDWQSNSNLRRCTHEEKGIWIEVLCVLHDQGEYGISRWSLAEIAQAIGTTVTKLRRLIIKGVLKGADAGQQCEALVYVPRSGRRNGPAVTLIPEQEGPIWYSSRMVIDEYKRILRGEAGGAPKAPPEHAPKGGFGEAPKDAPDDSPSSCARASRAGASSSSPSSSSSSKVRTKAPAAPAFDPLPDLKAQGVGEQVIADWLSLRTKKRAPVTKTVLDTHIREADRAGLTLEQALVLSCTRGWTGFDASWVMKEARGAPGKPAPFNATTHVNRHRTSHP